MSTLSSNQHLAALQYPWHAKRGKPKKMLQVSPPACFSPHASRVNSPVEKEKIRRQIVGLAVKRDNISKAKGVKSGSSATTRNTSLSASVHEKVDSLTGCLRSSGVHDNRDEGLKRETTQQRISNKRTRFYIQGEKDTVHNHKMPHNETRDSQKDILGRPKTVHNSENKSKPKIVRFRMDEFTIGKHKAPIVSITDNKEGKDAKNVQNGHIELGQTYDYEVRGSAMAVRKEGLKGLLAYKDICAENEKRQNTLHTSLKIFRRRIKLNQEKFIQPNETTSEDYVIHTRSPVFDVNAQAPVVDEHPTSRPLSSDEHVRILRSALHNKHNGGNSVVKQTDIYDTGESYKNIKCSYRLPENPNWGKEVSFKDIKDDVIPNVKTYVLAEETHPHAKFKKNSVQNSVTLNTHNLNVHNSITQVNGQKVKVGDSEISFDPRFLDWIEDSLSNIKLYKTSTFISEDTMDSIPSSVKRRIATKT